MPKLAEYTWYIEPFDANTNEVLGKNLDEDNARSWVRCPDRKMHNFWRCDWAFVQKIRKSKA